MQRSPLLRAEAPESALVKEAKDATRGFGSDPELVAMALKLIQDRDDWTNRLRQPVRR